MQNFCFNTWVCFSSFDHYERQSCTTIYLKCCNKGRAVGEEMLFLVANGDEKLSGCSQCVLPSRWPGLRLLVFQTLFSKRATLLAKGPRLAELDPFDTPISSLLYLPKKFYAQKGKNGEVIQLQDSNEICVVTSF